MPEIKAFRAWRYNPVKIKNAANVVAPPYDVISREQQEKLYSIDPHNVIRLELGKKTQKDGDTDNCYTRARATLERWKSQQVLIREETPTLYIYAQDYREEGKNKTRLGFYAAMRLDEKAVLKHENTLTGPKEDRLKLLKEVRTNLSPIFGLFEDKKGAVQSALKASLKRAPIMDVTVDNVRHRLYREKNSAVIRKVVSAMRSKPMFIADGHHRFEVACQYKKWMSATMRKRIRPKALTDSPALWDEEAQQSGDGSGAEWNFVLAYFSDCLHNPFRIFPTHRLIRIPQGKDFRKTLEKIGALEKTQGLKQVLSRLSACRSQTKDKKYRFGFYSKKEGFWILTLNKKTAPSVKKNPVDTLDVAVLHKKVLEPYFGVRIDPAHSSSQKAPRMGGVDFTRDAEEACRRVQSGDFDLAVFLRPTSLTEMLLVSKKGLKMPQKSTYFYPKLLTGLVFHGFEKES